MYLRVPTESTIAKFFKEVLTEVSEVNTTTINKEDLLNQLKEGIIEVTNSPKESWETLVNIGKVVTLLANEQNQQLKHNN